MNPSPMHWKIGVDGGDRGNHDKEAIYQKSHGEGKDAIQRCNVDLQATLHLKDKPVGT